MYIFSSPGFRPIWKPKTKVAEPRMHILAHNLGNNFSENSSGEKRSSEESESHSNREIESPSFFSFFFSLWLCEFPQISSQWRAREGPIETSSLRKQPWLWAQTLALLWSGSSPRSSANEVPERTFKMVSFSLCLVTEKLWENKLILNPL